MTEVRQEVKAQGKNKSRVIDNLDDLDKEFCQTLDKLLILYKRIIIRAYQIKEEEEKIKPGQIFEVNSLKKTKALAKKIEEKISKRIEEGEK